MIGLVLAWLERRRRSRDDAAAAACQSRGYPPLRRPIPPPPEPPPPERNTLARLDGRDLRGYQPSRPASPEARANPPSSGSNATPPLCDDHWSAPEFRPDGMIVLSRPRGRKYMIKPAPTWQPIETAPRDGTAVLVFIPDAGADEAIAVAEWFWSTGSWQICTDYTVNPTHWQPLPPPPTA